MSGEAESSNNCQVAKNRSDMWPLWEGTFKKTVLEMPTVRENVSVIQNQNLHRGVSVTEKWKYIYILYISSHSLLYFILVRYSTIYLPKMFIQSVPLSSVSIQKGMQREVPHNQPNVMRINSMCICLCAVLCTFWCVWVCLPTPEVALPDKSASRCAWSLSLAVRNIASPSHFITEQQLWQKPWHRNLS